MLFIAVVVSFLLRQIILILACFCSLLIITPLNAWFPLSYVHLTHGLSRECPTVPPYAWLFHRLILQLYLRTFPLIVHFGSVILNPYSVHASLTLPCIHPTDDFNLFITFSWFSPSSLRSYCFPVVALRTIFDSPRYSSLLFPLVPMTGVLSVLSVLTFHAFNGTSTTVPKSAFLVHTMPSVATSTVARVVYSVLQSKWPLAYISTTLLMISRFLLATLQSLYLSLALQLYPFFPQFVSYSGHRTTPSF